MDNSELDSNETLPIFYIAQHESNRNYSVNAHILQQAQNSNYDLLTTHVTNDIFRERVNGLLSRRCAQNKDASKDSPSIRIDLPSLRPIDAFLRPAQHVGQLIAFTSSWIDTASPNPIVAETSCQILNLEVAYAAFCGVMNIVIRSPTMAISNVKPANVTKFAHAIRHILTISPHVQIHILTPFDNQCHASKIEEYGSLTTESSQDHKSADEADEKEHDPLSSWSFWNTVRSVCKYSSRLSVALHLPQASLSASIQSRWFSEPIRILHISEKSFLRNAKDYPVLSKSNQMLISTYIRLNPVPWIILADVGSIPGIEPIKGYGDLSVASSSDSISTSTYYDHTSSSPTPSEAAKIHKDKRMQKPRDPTPHLSYVRHLQRNQPQKPSIERFGAGYQDYLQAPLQPLTTDLESITYEVFETDPIKYSWYQRAVEFALNDWSAQSKSTSFMDGSVVVAVVGSGRGPLVTRVINASRMTGVKVKVWAVEKNPNACVVLEQHNRDDWGNTVVVVNYDMRSWSGPTRSNGYNGNVDILVSELLGSFGDNELSPECLDGAQKVLNPKDGISIPSQYSSYLTPISAPRLHAEINIRALSEKRAYETPYVVMLHAIDYLSKELKGSTEADLDELPRNDGENAGPNAQLVWSFAHPNLSLNSQTNQKDGDNSHNSRYAHLKYKCGSRGVCHGLAGYFEAVLYKGNAGIVELSTNPLSMERKSKEMISWFPIFFPLKTPLMVSNHSVMNVSIWRQTDNKKVWYEWLVEAFVKSQVGVQQIGLSDMHSSNENGCLM